MLDIYRDRLYGRRETLSFSELAHYVTLWREDKKFYTPGSLSTESERDMMLGKLMLVVTEVSEAAEAVRDGDLPHFQEELADIFIRLLDISGAMMIDPYDEVIIKMAVNEEREPRHGRDTSL
jgi:NTP pyrophosphatase (non-canonical NTP hydrolase)